MVRAGADGPDHLLRLGGREDEHDVLGRLLDDLEEGVEALRRHHVRLVEDEDLVPVAGGREDGALAQVAGVVDAVVAGGVDLDDIERPAAVAAQLDAARAGAAGGVGGALRAVEAAGEDAGRRGLAAAAGAAEQVRVVDPIGAQSGTERVGDLRLTDQLRERLRAVATVEGGDHRTRVTAGGDTGARARGPCGRCRGSGPGRGEGRPIQQVRGRLGRHARGSAGRTGPDLPAGRAGCLLEGGARSC